MSDEMRMFDQAFDDMLSEILADMLLNKYEKAAQINDLFEVRRIVKNSREYMSEWHITA